MKYTGRRQNDFNVRAYLRAGRRALVRERAAANRRAAAA